MTSCSFLLSSCSWPAALFIEHASTTTTTTTGHPAGVWVIIYCICCISDADAFINKQPFPLAEVQKIIRNVFAVISSIPVDSIKEEGNYHNILYLNSREKTPNPALVYYHPLVKYIQTVGKDNNQLVSVVSCIVVSTVQSHHWLFSFFQVKKKTKTLCYINNK